MVYLLQRQVPETAMKRRGGKILPAKSRKRRKELKYRKTERCILAGLRVRYVPVCLPGMGLVLVFYWTVVDSGPVQTS